VGRALFSVALIEKATVKAVVIHAPGAPEQLVMADVPEPDPGHGQVLVDVAFAGCNWADTQIRTGIYPHARTYPLVLGLEVAGTVAKLGPDVKGIAIGERVAAFLEQGGAYAQKAVVAANMLMRLPDSISLDIGAALTVQPLTGYHMLHTIYRLKSGDTVLINAIGGGVGLFTTQLAVNAGARVIGTVGTPGKEKLALDYGAERVIVTPDEDFEQAVMEFSGGRGVDLAIDSLGATMLDRTFNVVRKLGHIISIGEAEGQPFKNIRERILPRSQTFTRLHIGHVDAQSQAWKDSLDLIPRGVVDGWLKVPMAGTFPMEEAAAMHRYLESRQAAGKLVLQIAR
jgi:NADPH2:quinone reductase